MKLRVRVFLMVGLLASSCAYGQGTLHITFDGPPPQLPGTAFLIQKYQEGGMSFVPLPGSVGIVRNGGGRDDFPENGSPYLQAALGTSLMFNFVNGTLFDMISVDLAEFSILYQEPLRVHFIGYRADGSPVTADLTTDGIMDGSGPLADFQTFHFGPEFSNLTRVEIPTYGWALDNLIVAVPEPSAGALFLLGGSAMWFFRRSGSRLLRSDQSRPWST